MSRMLKEKLACSEVHKNDKQEIISIARSLLRENHDGVKYRLKYDAILAGVVKDVM